MPRRYGTSMISLLLLKAKANRSLLLCLLVLGAVTAMTLLPFTSRSARVSADGNAHGERPEFPNYDLRHEKTKIADYLVAAATASKKLRRSRTCGRFRPGESELKTRVRNVKFEYNTDLRVPEVIPPDVAEEWNSSEPSGLKRSESC